MQYMRRRPLLAFVVNVMYDDMGTWKYGILRQFLDIKVGTLNDACTMLKVWLSKNKQKKVTKGYIT